jgi:hypothetical protein
MNRGALVGWSLLSGLLVAGCPIFPDDPSGCVNDAQCRPGYACDVDLGVCFRPATGRTCDAPSDCADREICGADGRCHTGSCSISGCVTGYECDGSSGVWTCLPIGSAGAGGSAGGDNPTAGAGGAAATSGAAGESGSAGTGAGGAAGSSAGAAGQNAAGAAGSTGGAAGGG